MGKTQQEGAEEKSFDTGALQKKLGKGSNGQPLEPFKYSRPRKKYKATTRP